MISISERCIVSFAGDVPASFAAGVLAESVFASTEYFYWVLCIPLAGFSAFLLDGICIGATATHYMLRAMAVASAAFFLTYYGLQEQWNNHALWLAFILYLILRGSIQAWLGRKIITARDIDY